MIDSSIYDSATKFGRSNIQFKFLEGRWSEEGVNVEKNSESACFHYSLINL